MFRRIGQRVSDGIRRFMFGRYGLDQLNVVLMVAAVALCLISFLFSRINAVWTVALSFVLNLLSYVLLFWYILRAFSRNIEKRNRENRRFLAFRSRLTDKQNRYYHFVCAYFAHCYGCTEFEAEHVYMKQYAARNIFLVEHEDKRGKTIRYFRSSADLDTAEMASAIKNFLAYAECNGIMIPYETDELGRRYCEQQLEKSNGFR